MEGSIARSNKSASVSLATTPSFGGEERGVHFYSPVCLSPQIASRRSDVLAQTAARRSQLEESLSLQQFLQDADEARNWIHEKAKVAGDEAFKVSACVCVCECVCVCVCVCVCSKRLVI